MIELICFECGEHLGYMVDAGPIGLTYCDDCAEEEEDE